PTLTISSSSSFSYCTLPTHPTPRALLFPYTTLFRSMRVKPSQLVTGCILLNDVIGKTDQPIMTKQTVLSKKHITVLKKFLVDYVDVSRKLNNGEVFEPTVHETNHPSASFLTHYLADVYAYKNLFTGSQNSFPIDMASIRNTLMTL